MDHHDSYLKRTLTRKDLVAVAAMICHNDWKRYARQLEFDETDIQSIEQELVPEEQRFQFLYQWHQRQTNPTFNDLVEAASALRLRQLAQKIEELAKETSPVDSAEQRMRMPALRSRLYGRDCKREDTQPLRSPTLQKSDDSDGSEPILIYKPWHSMIILDGHENLCLAMLVFLFVFFSIQLGLAIAHVYHLDGSSYHGNYHSSLAFSLVFFLRLFARCGLPLVLLIVTIHVTRKRANETVPVPQGDFRRKIEEERNESVLKEVIHHFWCEGLACKTQKEILQTIRQHFKKALTIMHVVSFLEAVLLTVALWRLDAASYIPLLYQQMKYPGALVLRVLDILTFFVLNFSSGVMSSFFFHEITEKHLVAAVVKVNDYSKVKLPKDLKRAAKATVDCMVSSWTILELFLYVSVQVYTVIVLTSAAAQIPLSYGIQGDMYPVSWLIFVGASTVLHVLSTSPYHVPVIRGIGIVLEVLGVFWLFCFDIPKFGGFLQIMYVTIPGAYLFWYLVAMSYHEYIVLGQKLQHSRVKHCRRFGRNMAFLLQWTSVLFISIICEYLLLLSRANGPQPAVGSEVPFHVNNAETFSRTVQIGSHFIQETCVCYGNSTSSPCSCLSNRGP